MPRYQSARLEYRAVLQTDRDNVFQWMCDPDVATNQTLRFVGPPSRKEMDAVMDSYETRLLNLSIYTLPTVEAPTPVHIGRMNLQWSEHGPIHRCLVMGILIGPTEYTGKGYGSEAIRWQVAAAFDWFGAHRVELQAFEWNARALHVYEKLGFSIDGRRRQACWFEGKFWDEITMGLLEDEYRSLRETREWYDATMHFDDLPTNE